ncbi:porin [Colwellia sp. MB02u-18]|uniref:porin n=1 Tax=unclassified Colwellia TaxID=196834 RepID=UPI0015F69BBA|nr:MULTISPECIES: porin [unclassified Colwellia]MBA6223275.1 porin [Colwellia sp. MB3u-45]MBA6266419.1 porin [Colwellia sp. MB3u-43]MBA6297321.1 porin [Colwellia sp. MB02u-9]MBA6322434.1 porin [Colwellia sp. MB02u-19]MBA6324433.1 porin [Colwellia sp. MB02u-18]
MKHTYNKIAVVLLSSLSLSAFAADVEVYGKANLSLQSSDEGEGSFTEVKSNASRIGLKGTHDLGEGLSVIYKAEFQVDLDGDSAKGDSITDRNQYVGLAGGFGEVLLGKNDTMLKQSQGKVDLFSDLNGDIKSLWKGENRMADTLSYKSPKFSDFQLGVTYIAEDAVDAEDGVSVAIFYGDAKLKKSAIFASVAVDSDVNGYDITRATVQGKVSGVVLGAIVQSQEKIDGSGEMDGFMVSAKYKMDKITFKGQYQAADFKDGDDKSGITLGADYSLAKSTKLYTFYTTFDMDSGEDQDYLAAGIEYKF